MTETVTLDIHQGVAQITLNRPEAANAFNAQLRSELLSVFNRVNHDDAIRVIVLQANGKVFCAGADLREQHPPGQTADQRINECYKPLFLGMVGSKKPIVGVVEGTAAGIGCALALSCDLLVMTEEAGFLQAFSAVGLVPDGGMTWHLPRFTGTKRAYELMVMGEKISAAECLELGMVNSVVASGEARAVAADYCQRLLTRAPLSLQFTKQALRESASLTLAETISMEASLQKITSASADHAEGKVAFREKRAPQWRGQ